MNDSALNLCFYCADQNPGRDRSTGITTYTAGLLSYLSQHRDISLRAVVSQSSFKLPADIARTVLPFRTDRIIGRLAADQLHPLLVKNDADVWHYPKGFLPFGIQVKPKKIGTVADTILQHYADKYPRSRSRAVFKYWIGMLKRSIERFDVILTVSEFSKRMIQEFSARYRITCPPIVVTYQGAYFSEGDTASQTPKEDYVVHLGSKASHKRTEWLLKQWFRLQQGEPNLPTLRLIGEVPVDADLSKIKRLEVCETLSGSEYVSALRAARALILPSEIEGFGLPALEGYSLGTPVAYVLGTAVDEILGPKSPGGFDFNYDSFKNAVSEVLSLNEMTVTAKAEELRIRFDWEKCASRTIAAYRSLC
jgi:glycosyltransferase involved in cell wall biosynthesis